VYAARNARLPWEALNWRGVWTAAVRTPGELVALIDERRDVLIDLSPKHRGDHPPSALPSEIIQRDLQLLGLRG
jgi:hypothetical protein